MAEYDFLVRNIGIVDGTGKPLYKGSIGITKDKVAGVGELTGDGKETIEGERLVAIPGVHRFS